jgi:hypothetical protein
MMLDGAGNANLKIWQATDPEPTSWTLTTTTVATSWDVDIFMTLSENNVGTATGTFQNLIAIGVDVCTTTQYDGFNRTVAADSWGVATPAGFTWKLMGPGGATRSVTAGYGEVLQLDSGTVPNQHGNVYEYDDTSTGIWGGDFNMLAVVEIVTMPDTANTGTLATWAVGLSEASPYDGSFGQAVFIAKRDVGHSDNDTLTFVPSVGSPVTVALGFSIVSPTVYNLRWVKSGTSHSMTFWPNGTSEPSPDISTTDTAITAAAFIIFQQQPFTRIFVTDPNATLDTRWMSVDFDYAGKPCYSGGPLPGSGISSNAWVCETFAVVATTVTLTHPFLVNSPRVWLNGLLQPQSSYTQNGIAGTVTFDFTPLATDNARVCYWATA